MKRDRWESSSDEEDEDKQVETPAVTAPQPLVKKARTEVALPKHNPLTSGCRSVYDCYERLARLDEGTYGVVWKAKDLGALMFVLDGGQNNRQSLAIYSLILFVLLPPTN